MNAYPELAFEAFDRARTFLNQAYSLEAPVYFDDPEELRKHTKASLRCFLNYLFNSDNVEKVSNINPAHYCVFYLKNDNGWYDKYQFFVSATCHYASFIIKNDSYAVQLNTDIQNQRAVGIFIISKIMNHKRVEWVYNTQIEGRLPDSFWDSWEDDTFAATRYEQYIYPSIHKAASKIIDDWKGDELFTILDVGGGKGTLAERIVSLMPFYSNYVLLEKNEASVKIAREVVGQQVSVVSTDIVVEERFFRDEAKRQPLKAASVSIAIACGVLARGVLNNQADALKVLKKIYTYIKPCGFLIVTGHTPSFVQAKELQAVGFEIITMSIPEYIGIQFYVARKRLLY